MTFALAGDLVERNSHQEAPQRAGMIDGKLACSRSAEEGTKSGLHDVIRIDSAPQPRTDLSLSQGPEPLRVPAM
jgi:hypothetical protein